MATHNISGTYVRHHCSKCHTFLYGQVTVAQGIPPYIACAAIDGDSVGNRPVEHLFVRSKVSWHEIGEGGNRHDTYPPM
ncbi:MAG: hypothetical protein EXR77_04190 [Myxococcales bacterium]|nr:hypothetical protein [Myxococcales bacterium]